VPQVRAFAINQGLPSYPDLVRGKNILFRLFLSAPACADGTSDWVALTAASLNIKVGPATVMTVAAPLNSLAPPPHLTPYASAPAVPDAAADPKWLVDGQELADIVVGPAPITFEAILAYTNSAGGSGALPPINAVGGTPMEKKLLYRTRPMRVLAIPMGDPSKTFDSQFSTAAHVASEEGFEVFGRIFPVAEGTADLSAIPDLEHFPRAGVLYHLNLDALIDVSAYMTNPWNSSGRFCDDGSALETLIAPQLADHLLQYNEANARQRRAEHALGLIDYAISSECTDGYALVNSPFAYAKVRYTDPVRPGTMIAHELGHTLGLVPCAGDPECQISRESPTDQGHAPFTWAHSSAPLDIAFNLLTHQQVPDDQNVMKFTSQVQPGLVDTRTFFQREDWEMALCELGGPPTNDCVYPIARYKGPGDRPLVRDGMPTINIVGTTDGTRAGTRIQDSFLGSTSLHSPVPLESDVTLVQRDDVGRVLDRRPVFLPTPEKGHGTSSVHWEDGPAFISLSAPAHERMKTFELVGHEAGEVLYRRQAGSRPPTISRLDSTTTEQGFQTRVVIVVSTGSAPRDMRASFFTRCRGAHQVVRAGLTPASVGGGKAHFRLHLDMAGLCRQRGVLSLLVRLNNGYQQTALADVPVRVVTDSFGTGSFGAE
jgi:hypothetical protein